MNQSKCFSFLLIIVLSALVVGCGDKSVTEIPALPDFDASTEKAVVKTIEEHHEALKSEPTFDNLREYAKVLQAHRHENLASKVYEQCLAMKEDFECFYLAGRILKRSEPKLSRDYLEKALKIREDYAPLYLDICECFDLVGQHEEAIVAAKKSLSLESSALGHFLLGRNLLAAKKAAEAIPSLERANLESPGQKSIMNLLVRAYSDTNQVPKAEAMAKKIAKENDNQSAIASRNPIMRAVLLKGRSYQSMLTRVVGALQAGRFDVALKAADERLKVKPEVSGNHALRGDAHHGLKRYALAVKDFEQAAELDAENALIRLKLSKSLVMVGRQEDAFKQVVKARQLDPKDPEARFYYAYHVWQKRPAAAEMELRVTLRYEPGHIEARTLLAKILFVLGRPIDARVEIDEILVRSPNNQRVINLREQYKDAR
jgi:tetratricopeptide (TPR) repeat protein